MSKKLLFIVFVCTTTQKFSLKTCFFFKIIWKFQDFFLILHPN